jgi:hypothetical protein
MLNSINIAITEVFMIYIFLLEYANYGLIDIVVPLQLLVMLLVDRFNRLSYVLEQPWVMYYKLVTLESESSQVYRYMCFLWLNQVNV